VRLRCHELAKIIQIANGMAKANAFRETTQSTTSGTQHWFFSQEVFPQGLLQFVARPVSHSFTLQDASSLQQPSFEQLVFPQAPREALFTSHFVFPSASGKVSAFATFTVGTDGLSRAAIIFAYTWSFRKHQGKS
jgi:hypothetical protein